MKNESKPSGNRRIGQAIGFPVILFVFLVFALFPFLWIVLTSVKSQKDLFAIPPLFVFTPMFEHWQKIIMRSEFLRYYKNSLVIALSTVVFVMAIATLAAYGLVRGSYKTKLRDNIAFFILSQRMMPPVAVVLPIYILFAGIRMLDRIQTLIFMNIAFNLPLSIWMIRGFVDGLSSEIEEAAVVDGCTPFGAFIKVGIPQISPGLLSTALLVFIYTINEFFFRSYSREPARGRCRSPFSFFSPPA
jgi:multiple sugar transport system permease protein